jgi:hypothetical protein
MSVALGSAIAPHPVVTGSNEGVPRATLRALITDSMSPDGPWLRLCC